MLKNEGYWYQINAWKQFESIRTDINDFQVFFDLIAYIIFIII